MEEGAPSWFAIGSIALTLATRGPLGSGDSPALRGTARHHLDGVPLLPRTMSSLNSTCAGGTEALRPDSSLVHSHGETRSGKATRHRRLERLRIWTFARRAGFPMGSFAPTLFGRRPRGVYRTRWSQIGHAVDRRGPP
jgi:hypothetical protein